MRLYELSALTKAGETCVLDSETPPYASLTRAR